MWTCLSPKLFHLSFFHFLPPLPLFLSPIFPISQPHISSLLLGQPRLPFPFESDPWWCPFQNLKSDHMDETNRWRERMNARKWREGMNSPHDEVDSMQMKQQCRWNLWHNWIDSFGLFDDINGIGWTWMKWKLMDELFLQYEVDNTNYDDDREKMTIWMTKKWPTTWVQFYDMHDIAPPI